MLFVLLLLLLLLLVLLRACSVATVYRGFRGESPMRRGTG